MSMHRTKQSWASENDTQIPTVGQGQSRQFEQRINRFGTR
jgi:hypothetical protein